MADSTSSPTGVAPRESANIPALDGLRGLAVIGVLLFHDDRLIGGFLGVDLFFALSGMLITGLLIDERNRRGAIDLKRFWSRRFRRLLPALVLMLAAIVPLMRLWGSPAQLEAAKDGVLPGLFYMSNWQQIRETSDYWALFTDPSPLTHLWSLAVEAQFYIAWPLLVVLIARLPRWRVKLGVLTLAMIAASGALMWVLFDPGFPTRSYVGTDTRAASILAGAMVALIGLPRLVARWASRSHFAVQALQVAIVTGLAWAWLTVDGSTSTRLPHGGYLLHSVAGAVLAGTLGLSKPTVVQRVLSFRMLRGVGLVSYGWYLWHWPVYIVLTPERMGLHGWGLWWLTAMRWGVSLALTLASYYLLEMPVRHRTLLKGRFTAPAAFAGATALIVAAIVLIPTPDTSPAAFDPGSIDLPTTTSPPTTSVSTGSSVPTDVTTPASTAPTTAAQTTTTLPRRLVRSVVWEGDSVAFDSALGVDAALKAAGLDASDATYFGVGLVPDKGIDPMKVFVDPVLERRPDLVLFQISGWDAFFTPDEQRTGFDAYTSAVLATGAALVFVTPPPTDPDKPDVEQHFEVMLGFARDLAAQRPGEAWVLDADALWGAFAYDINGDGVPERKPDGVHVCPQGSALLGNWLAYELAILFDGITPAPPADWAGGDWVNDQRYDNPAGACA